MHNNLYIITSLYALYYLPMLFLFVPPMISLVPLSLGFSTKHRLASRKGSLSLCSFLIQVLGHLAFEDLWIRRFQRSHSGPVFCFAMCFSMLFCLFFIFLVLVTCWGLFSGFYYKALWEDFVIIWFGFRLRLPSFRKTHQLNAPPTVSQRVTGPRPIFHDAAATYGFLHRLDVPSSGRLGVEGAR